LSLGDQSPLFCYLKPGMIEKSKIEKLVNEFIKGTGIFLVAVKVSSSNRITVLVDTMQGITIDDCVALHRFIEKNLDRNKEDYEMQVSSPGLDMPFGVIEQYYKNEGKSVEVTGIDGAKFSGKLKNVTSGGFELETEVMVSGKLKEIREISFNLDQIKSTRIVLTIK
jgi:ribosome maturation factor RimP